MDEAGLAFLLGVVVMSLAFVVFNAMKLRRLKKARRNLDVAWEQYEEAFDRYQEVFRDKGPDDPETEDAYMDVGLTRIYWEQAMNESRRARGDM